jgi:hypothetical protein
MEKTITCKSYNYIHVRSMVILTNELTTNQPHAAESRKFLTFMVLEDSFPRSQNPTNDLYSEPNELSLNHMILFLFSPF